MEKTDKSYSTCIVCGGYLCWNSDEMMSEVSDEYKDDDVAVMRTYVCMTCGRVYEINDPPEEERSGLYKEYWNKYR